MWISIVDLRLSYAAAVLPHASVPATVAQRLLGGMINAALVCAACALVPLPPVGRAGAGAGVALVCVVSQALTGAGPGQGLADDADEGHSRSGARPSHRGQWDQGAGGADECGIDHSAQQALGDRRGDRRVREHSGSIG